ncbi:hypothetical protein KKD04_02135 [Patescibacteria group bacterium]|nr:hypothetical protein [Patescibacteria group bacterium]
MNAPLNELIVFLILLVAGIALKIFSSRAKTEKNNSDSKPETKTDKKTVAKTAKTWGKSLYEILMALIIMAVGALIVISLLKYLLFPAPRYQSGYQTQYSSPAKTGWYFSSENRKGKMETADIVKMDASDNSLSFTYKLLRRRGQVGEINTTSEDGKKFTGTYQYPGESGDVELTQKSQTLYEGNAIDPNDGRIEKIQVLKSPS